MYVGVVWATVGKSAKETTDIQGRGHNMCKGRAPGETTAWVMYRKKE